MELEWRMSECFRENRKISTSDLSLMRYNPKKDIIVPSEIVLHKEIIDQIKEIPHAPRTLLPAEKRVKPNQKRPWG